MGCGLRRPRRPRAASSFGEVTAKPSLSNRTTPESQGPWGGGQSYGSWLGEALVRLGEDYPGHGDRPKALSAPPGH